MAATPPPTQPGQPGGGYGYRGPTMNWSAIMPTPGNAELVVWIIALIVAIIITAAASSVVMLTWFDFFKWTTVAYLLSRGIAKASRVLER
jgi:hypothetical protein